MEEKRKSPRLTELVDVFYNKCGSTEREKLSIAKDISKGGICLIAYEEFKKLDYLDLKISLPECQGIINALGEVTWVKEFVVGDDESGERRYSVGIKFIKIDGHDQELIAQFVNSLIEKIKKF